MSFNIGGKNALEDDQRVWINSVDHRLRRLESNIAPKAIGAFSAIRASAANQSITSGVTSLAQFNSREHDTDTWYDTLNFRFNPKIAGYYRLNAFASSVESIAAGKFWVIYLFKNGVLYRELYYLYANAAQTGSGGGTALCYANGTSDYFDIRIFQNNGSNVNIDGRSEYSYFQGDFIGSG